MSYCQDFKYDVFISYAHTDNWDRWIDDLHQALLDRLPEDLYQKPAIWRDTGGLDGKLIDDGIKGALENSAVFLAVVSGAFLNSTYCVPVELAGFHHRYFPNTIRDYSRVVTAIYKIPPDRPIENWPEALRAVQGVHFDSANGPPLRPPRRDPETRYWRAMEELVRKIIAVLAELKKGIQGAEVAELEPVVPAAANGLIKRTAYQAIWKPNVHLTYDASTSQQAQQLIAELEPQCESVSALPYDASQTRRLTNLKNCDGHILLFDCPNIEWAEGLTPESLAAASGQGRPKKIGLYTDCPANFALRNSRLRPIERTPDGLKKFVADLKENP